MEQAYLPECINSMNKRSGNIPKRLNYYLEGNQREIHFDSRKSQHVSLDVYSKLRSEYNR